jgi:hypothetical protein
LQKYGNRIGALPDFGALVRYGDDVDGHHVNFLFFAGQHPPPLTMLDFPESAALVTIALLLGTVLSWTCLMIRGSYRRGRKL